MRCKDITPITEARSKFAKALEIQFHENDFYPELLQQLATCLQKHLLKDEGLPLQLVYTCSQGRACLMAADSWKVVPHDQLLEELRQLLGRNNVQLIYMNEGETTASPQKISA
jgi:DNA polymerase-3 subunit alpha